MIRNVECITFHSLKKEVLPDKDVENIATLYSLVRISLTINNKGSIKPLPGGMSYEKECITEFCALYSNV